MLTLKLVISYGVTPLPRLVSSWGGVTPRLSLMTSRRLRPSSQVRYVLEFNATFQGYVLGLNTTFQVGYVLGFSTTSQGYVLGLAPPVGVM